MTYAVPPATGTKIQAPHDSFVDEAHLLQSPLLGQVVGLSAGLDPVGGGHVEQVPDQLALGLGPNAPPAVLREQGNSDLEVAVPSSRPPVDPARAGTVLERKGKERLLARKTVLLPSPAEVEGILGPEAEPLELTGQAWLGEEAQQLVYVPFLDRTEADDVTHRAIEPPPADNGNYLSVLRNGPRFHSAKDNSAVGECRTHKQGAICAEQD